ASLWSRQLTFLAVHAEGLQRLQTVPLPFAPRCQQLLLDEQQLLVADAFGGRLALVDVGRGEVESVRSLPVPNIRGLSLSPYSKQVLLVHQMLNPRASSTLDDIHWGNLLTNNVRRLSLEQVSDPQGDLLKEGKLQYLGEVGHAAGDPSGIAVHGSDVLVPLA